MGQKVNPYGFRLGVTTEWKSRWFSERDYKQYLTEDWKIRQYIMTVLPDAAISRIEIAENVWDESFDPFSNTIEVYIARLRKKIDGESAVKLIHQARR